MVYIKQQQQNCCRENFGSKEAIQVKQNLFQQNTTTAETTAPIFNIIPLSEVRDVKLSHRSTNIDTEYTATEVTPYSQK